MDIFLVRAIDDSEQYKLMGRVPRPELPPPITRYLTATGTWHRDQRLAARFESKRAAAVAQAQAVVSGDRDLALESTIVRADVSECPVDISKAWQEAEARLDVDVGYQLAVVRQEDGTYAAVEITSRPMTSSEACVQVAEGTRALNGDLYAPTRLSGTVHGTGESLPDLLASIGRADPSAPSGTVTP